VLHHTYSTHEAFLRLARYCAPGGLLYLWVYGPRSISDNLFRRAVYATEVVLRWVLNRTPAAVSSAVLSPVALGYLAFNGLRHRQNPHIQRYTYRRALHAARDRYTPEYAHRQDADTVSAWFKEAGYGQIEVVDWRDMPTADHDDFRRNTGVRGRRRPG
jgi:hypothetical protein